MALVVIGGVAAGLSAAARARRLDSHLEIVVLEKGPVISYGACGLPYFVEGRVRDAGQLIVYTPEYFRKERRIEVRTGARVVAISHPRREVTLETGGRVHYDRLVIATGARCDTSGFAGAGQPHVFTLHTLDDAERMRRFLDEKKPRRAVVIGAGYIGVEAADALRRNGLRVTMLERSQHALLRDEPWITAAVRKQLEEHGVELRCGVSVQGIEVDRVADVPCDMVVVSAGFKPNVEIATAAGVEAGRSGAIRTSERMETNLNGVYAAGDCAEVMHLVTGRPTYIPLGTTANKAGRVAGANAAGGRERFGGIVGTSIVGIFGTGFATTGLSVEQARREGFSPVAARIEAQARPRYFQGRKTTVELVADRGTRRLLGGAVIGEEGAAGRINVIAGALQSRLRVDDFEQLDLAYSPPFATVWDPLLIAAQQLMKEL
ncbi:FAD-dependent pyridine nucleotide-disulphide oxidoreductase [Candidatus Sulfopaludibacter sp. SbA4]|nr:FAD-dependent pyridine nucleotide-disulphide oxidoreductase [Candidatus Sulfopaludibacter sp. SbA4]